MARPTARVSQQGTTRPAPAVPDLDAVVHQRVRLGILSALVAGGATSFTDLRTVLSLTDGNLSVHARKLEDAGYIAVRKRFAGRVPLTEFEATDAGRAALHGYLDAMEAVIRVARG